MTLTQSILSRKNIIYFLSLLFLLILSGCEKGDAVVMKIGPVQVTQEEFDKAFQASEFPNNPDYRRLFMEQYVNQKLILMEAERRGLDKNQAFLDEIQSFWEERLLRAAMNGMYRDYAKDLSATDVEVEKIYAESKDNASLPADPESAKAKIREMIIQEKQSRLLVAWLENLRKETDVYVDENKLGIKKQ